MSPRNLSVSLLPLFFMTLACGEMPLETELFDQSIESQDDIFVPNNVTCSPESLNGFYETLTIRRSGECPDLDPFFLVMKDGEMTWGKNCETQSIAFTNQTCQQNTRIVCEGNGQQIIVDARLAQIENSGSILTGKMTIQFKFGEEQSAEACVSEYQTKLERLQ